MSGNQSIYDDDYQSVARQPLSVAPSSIQISLPPKSQIQQGADQEDNDLPQREDEYVTLRLEYKDTRTKFKLMKARQNELTNEELFELQQTKSTKREMKKILKQTEKLHPEWKLKNLK